MRAASTFPVRTSTGRLDVEGRSPESGLGVSNRAGVSVHDIAPARPEQREGARVSEEDQGGPR